jgi:hypothetical protein
MEFLRKHFGNDRHQTIQVNPAFYFCFLAELAFDGSVRRKLSRHPFAGVAGLTFLSLLAAVDGFPNVSCCILYDADVLRLPLLEPSERSIRHT